MQEFKDKTMMIRSLKAYFKLSTFLLSVVIFTILYIFSTILFISLYLNENAATSRAISSQISVSMYEVMRRGWTRSELEQFLASSREAFQSSAFEVEIYRAPVVEALYGIVSQKSPSAKVLKVFDNARTFQEQKNQRFQTITPMVATNECISCHSNAKAGDVLGAVEVIYDSTNTLKKSAWQFFLFSLILFPVLGILVYFITRFLFGRIDNALNNFQKSTRAINSVADFKTLDTVVLPKSFDEFDAIMLEVQALASKLKNVAVDKDILEFEVKLLDKLIITSEVVRDWKEYVEDLLHEINNVMPVYCLITIFKVEDEVYEVEIFWNGIPANDVKNYLEELSKDMIKTHHSEVPMSCHISHNIGKHRNTCINLSKDEIEHEAKSILLDSPKIGGIVGLGVQLNLSKDAIYAIVIDSILTTLLNLVGSIKAINKYTQSLEYYATRDPLTGLFSQRVFRDLLEYEVKRAKRHNYKFGVVMVDCDNFKIINDQYGHTFGDEYLKHLATVLSEAKDDEDILARYGGDEFALILPESDENECIAIADKLLQKIDETVLKTPNGKEINVTVSMGIAVYPEHGIEPVGLFNVADMMMYRVKNSGKHGIKLPTQDELDEIKQQNEDKSAMVLEALRQSAIFPHFQPIMDLKNNEIKIHELLMRIDLDDVLLNAGTFIETAESLGVVHQMDYMVIEKAFQKIQATNYQGILFINLSPKALMIGEFLKKIDILALKYSINKEHIVFEITERETVKSFVLLEKFVHNLKLEGFRFAIDDFGSGFSTFHYIKKFPIDFIKIDGEFILNIHQDKKDRAFVKSIVALAKELGVYSVAEFVENEDTLNLLKEMGVDYVQGYYIGKPKNDFA
jgi:diguanylate cyclase (GGDEF)-like protein